MCNCVRIHIHQYRMIVYTYGVFTIDGVGCMDIELSDEPNLGTWRVDTRLVMVSPSYY